MQTEACFHPTTTILGLVQAGSALAQQVAGVPSSSLWCRSQFVRAAQRIQCLYLGLPLDLNVTIRYINDDSNNLVHIIVFKVVLNIQPAF